MPEERKSQVVIEIKGVDLIIDKLGELGNKIEKEAWDELVRLSNAEIKERAKTHAPFETGHLKDNIKVWEDWNAGEIFVYADANYAEYLEFGWWLTKEQLAAMAMKGILKSDGEHHDYPQWTRIPFMKPAMDEGIPRLEEGLKNKVASLLK